MKYRGSLCELEVHEVVIENDETVGGVHSTDESHISERLSSVHLSSEPDVNQHKQSQRFFRCIHGTCVTLYKPPSAQRGNLRPAVTLDDVGGVDSQRDFLTRLVLSMLDVDRANAIKQSGKFKNCIVSRINIIIIAAFLLNQLCFLELFQYDQSSNSKLLLLLQPFDDPLYGTTQMSQYQKDKPFWILLKQR